MTEVTVLYKMGCSRCVGTLDLIKSFRQCNPAVKVNAKLVKGKTGKFNPDLSPMVFVDKKYVGSGRSSPCRSCSEMSGKAETCGSGPTLGLENKLKSFFCGNTKCCM